MERCLTTILAADIAGFSRLVAENEEVALTRRRSHRQSIIDPLLDAHAGKVANTASDSLLIEFPSAVQGLRFAMAMQTEVEAAEAGQPAKNRMLYRIGLNVGDVVAEGEDLLGDGVNIAARPEALADPGGILISRSTRDPVRDRVELDLVDLGEIDVKNIPRPVHSFQVVRGGEAARRRGGEAARHA